MASDFNMLDTNAALRLQLKDIPKQHRRISQLVAKQDRRFVITDIVVFEMVYVLRNSQYDFNRKQIKEFIEKLVDLPNIVCARDVIMPALEKYAKFSKLSFADCYLTEFARSKGYEPLWTFDKKLAKQSGMAKEVA
jgi:predicted nucleic acid-binding protein